MRTSASEGGLCGGAEKLKRGDEHAEFVRKEKEEKLKTAASQMSHWRKEGRAEIIERCDHCFHSFLQAGFSLAADLIRETEVEESAASKKSGEPSLSQTVH